MVSFYEIFSLKSIESFLEMWYVCETMLTKQIELRENNLTNNQVNHGLHDFKKCSLVRGENELQKELALNYFLIDFCIE